LFSRAPRAGVCAPKSPVVEMLLIFFQISVHCQQLTYSEFVFPAFLYESTDSDVTALAASLKNFTCPSAIVPLGCDSNGYLNINFDNFGADYNGTLTLELFYDYAVQNVTARNCSLTTFLTVDNYTEFDTSELPLFEYLKIM
jgi:hypothetical protein